MDCVPVMYSAITRLVMERWRKLQHRRQIWKLLEQVALAIAAYRAKRSFAMRATDKSHRAHLRCHFRQRNPELELAHAIRAVL